MQHVPIKVCCAELSLFLCPSVGETPETEMRRPHRRGTDSLPRNVTIQHTSQPRSVTCFRSNIDRRATQGIARAAAKLIGSDYRWEPFALCRKASTRGATLQAHAHITDHRHMGAWARGRSVVLMLESVADAPVAWPLSRQNISCHDALAEAAAAAARTPRSR